MAGLRSVALAAAIVLASTTAHADQGEVHLSVEPTYSMLTRPNAPNAHGAGAAISAWLGLAPAAWLFIAGGIHHAPEASTTVYEAAFGVTAALDVLRVVPFVEAAIAVDVVDGSTYPVLRAGIGADYLLTPAFALGLVGRQRFFFGNEGEGLLTLALRASWRFDVD